MMSRGLAALFLIGLFSVMSTLSAGVPTMVNHQGRLLDASDNPVPDGAYVLIFSLYSEPDAGIPLWTETRDVVTKDGLFSLMLGSLSPLDLSLFDSDSLYLQLQLGGEAPMTPRLRLGSVPFASKSGRVSGDIQTAPEQVSVGDLDGDGFLDFHSTADQSEVSVARKRPGRVKYNNISMRVMPDSVVDYRDCDSDDDGLSDSRMFATLGSGGGAGGSILIEADLEGDGVGDVGTESSSDLTRSILKTYFERGDKPTQSQFSSLTDEIGARLAINSKGTSAKREIKGSTDSDSASLVLLSDLDDDGLVDLAVSSSCDNSSAQQILYKKGLNAVNVKRAITSSTDDIEALHQLDADSDDDGVMDRTISSVCDATSSRMAIKTKGTGAAHDRTVSVSSTTGSSLGGVACDIDDDGDGFLEYRAVCTVTDADGDEGSDMRCSADTDDDGVDDNEASLHVTPTTSSMAIKTKGTGADKNRTVVSSNVDLSGASVVCGDDSDDDGVDDTDVSLHVTPTTSSVAINTKGTGADKNRVISSTDDTSAVVLLATDDASISLGVRKGGNVNGNIIVMSSSSLRMVGLGSDGNGYFAHGVGVGMDATHAIDVAGGAYCDGTNWVNASDENVKENFESVDGQALLEKISELEITKWNYKDSNDGMKHIGPTAQDFKKIFGVGSDGKTISTIDPSGISLAAIKELHKENISLKAQIADLMKQVDDLKVTGAATDELRAQIKKLTSMVETIMVARDSENNTTKLTSSH